MTLLEIINTINFIIGDKRPEMALLTPKRFSTMLHMASLKHFKRKLGLPEEYQVGMPLPRQAFDITQKITEDLRPFKEEIDGESWALFFTEGKSFYPGNYYYPVSMAAVINHELGTVVKRVRFVTDQRWDEMNGNYVDIPNEEYPIATFQKEWIRIAPKTINQAKFVYLRLPDKPVYAVKVSGNASVYDSEKSVQLEWDEINQIDIIAILLADLGLPLMRGDVIQIADKQKTQGI